MNIIETFKEQLSNCEVMDEFNGVHIDYTEAMPGEAGLFTNGAVKIGEDLLGNPKYQINFELVTGNRAAIEYDRLKNSDFFLKLTYFLDSIKGIVTTENVNGTEYPAEVRTVKCSNQLLYSVPTGDINDGVQYSFRITAVYIIEME